MLSISTRILQPLRITEQARAAPKLPAHKVIAHLLVSTDTSSQQSESAVKGQTAAGASQYCVCFAPNAAATTRGACKTQPLIMQSVVSKLIVLGPCERPQTHQGRASDHYASPQRTSDEQGVVGHSVTHRIAMMCDSNCAAPHIMHASDTVMNMSSIGMSCEAMLSKM